MLTIHELHEKLVRRDVSAVEVTKAFLAHKDTVEPKVRAFLSDSREGALKGAAAVDEKNRCRRNDCRPGRHSRCH